MLSKFTSMLASRTPRRPSSSDAVFDDIQTGDIPFVQKLTQEISDCVRFLARPNLRHRKTSTIKQRVFRVTVLTLAMLVFETPIILALNGIQSLSAVAEINQFHDAVDLNIFLLVILGPIIEEIFFRAGLRQPICCLFLIPLITLFHLTPMVPLNLIVFSFIVVVLAATAVAFVSGGGKSNCHRRTFTRKYPLCFWSICFMFAVVHTQTLSYVGSQFIIAIFLTLPHFVTGSLLGYLRIRDGIVSSIAAHSLINLVALAAFMLSRSAT